jgi:hypothetical protein
MCQPHLVLGRRRIAGIATGALLAVAGVPSAASADVITFDHGAARVSGGEKPVRIIGPADPLEINNVAYGPGNAFTTSAPGDFDFAPYSGTFAGVPYTIDIAPLAPVSGSFDPATGTMALDSVAYTTTVIIGGASSATCTYTNSHAFSTENKAVVLGDRFDPLGPPPVNGAVADVWEKVPGDPSPGCGATNTFANYIGGFWFSNGIEEPTFVAIPGFKCKKGQKRSRGRNGLKCVCKKPGRKLRKGRCVKKKKKRQPR